MMVMIFSLLSTAAAAVSPIWESVTHANVKFYAPGEQITVTEGRHCAVCGEVLVKQDAHWLT